MGLFSRENYGQRRLGGRFLIALIIAGIGLVSYYMNSEVNPVTGEKQRIALTTEQEITLGLQAAPEMAAQMGGEVNPSHPEAQLVKTIGRTVWQNSDALRSPYQFDFHLLSDSETINAFALPGGQIFITRGLLLKLENEAQVAGVLGHEIGHVINRHAAEHMAKGKLGQMLAAAAGVASSEDYGSRGAAVAAMVNQLAQLKYSRTDELESDDYGMRFMVQAGYDPRAMLGVMQVLASAAGRSRQPEFLATHPHPDARLEKIKDYLAKTYPHGVPENLTQGRPLSQEVPTRYQR
jgi:beta-barrel assembly-enhancing protease